MKQIVWLIVMSICLFSNIAKSDPLAIEKVGRYKVQKQYDSECFILNP